MTSSVSNSMGEGIRPLPVSLLTHMGMGSHRKFSRAGQNPQHLKRLTVFRCAEGADDIFCAFATFQTTYKGFYCERRRRERKIQGFTGEPYVTSSLSNSMGGGIRPLLTPMGACSLISKFCFPQNSHPNLKTIDTINETSSGQNVHNCDFCIVT